MKNETLFYTDKVKLLLHVDQSGEFEWDELDQSVVTGSFYWIYVLAQVPGKIII